MKGCMKGGFQKVTSTGSNLASSTPVCLRNRQADPPRINMGYSKEWRFLLERVRGYLYSLLCRHLFKRCPLKTSLPNQQKFLQNEGISILGNMAVELFNKRNDGLGNLSLSPRSKGRNRGRVICEHRRGKNKKPPHSLNVAPTNIQLW